MAADKKNPDNQDIKNDLNKLYDSIESEAFYKKETIKKGHGLKAPLQFILSYKEGDNHYPVANMPVYFHFIEGKGIISEESITDDTGIAKCFIEEITDYDKEVIIEAYIELKLNGECHVINSLIQRYTLNSTSIFDLPQTIFIFVDDDKNNIIKDIYTSSCNLLAGLFISSGFSNIRCISNVGKDIFNRAFNMDKQSIRVLGNEYNSDIITLVKLTPSFINRSSIDFFLSKADVSIKIIDVKPFSTRFEYSVTAKGAGPDKEKSKLQASSNTMKELNKHIDQYIKILRRENEL